VGSERGGVEVFNMQSGIKRKRYYLVGGVDDRFIGGHARSVTFVGMDKLNKTLVSAGSDGVVLVYLVMMD
jgi:hypothetical protein